MKNNLFKVIISIFIFTISLLSHAQQVSLSAGGDLIGNGGDVVECEKEVQLLDYYEARRTGLKFNTNINIDTDETGYALNLISPLKRLDPERHEKYKQWILSFMNETSFINEDLIDIFDAGRVIELPSSCRIRQIAFQYSPLFDLPGLIRYRIHSKLWESLSLVDRAGLIIHEVIYREAVLEGQLNSENTRHFNALISSQMFDSLTEGEYLNKLRNLQFQGNSNPSHLKYFFEFYKTAIENRSLLTVQNDILSLNKKTKSSIKSLTTYKKIFFYGKRVEFETEEKIEYQNWSLDKLKRKIEPPQIESRIISKKYSVIKLESTNELKVYEVPYSDTFLNTSTRGPMSGTVNLIGQSRFIMSLASVAPSDFEFENLGVYSIVPGLYKIHTEFIIQNDLIQTVSKSQLIRLNPITSEPIGVIEEKEKIVGLQVNGSSIDF